MSYYDTENINVMFSLCIVKKGQKIGDSYNFMMLTLEIIVVLI
jgi:hypothetical protein